MGGIKLGKLPDRTPVKLTINVSPDLKRAIDDYAACYADAYGSEEPITLSGQSAPCLTHH